MKPFTAHVGTRPRRAGRPGFTLIEILVVIAIIAFLAALIAGLGRGASEKKVRAAGETLIEALTLSIEGYRDTFGVYPPDTKDNPARPPLYYSLKGVLAEGDGIPKRTRDGKDVSAADLERVFGRDFRVLNSGPELGQVKDFFEGMKENLVGEENGVRYIVFPYKGPNGQFNPVHYDASSSSRRNRESYDLWIEVEMGGKTVEIGNRRD